MLKRLLLYFITWRMLLFILAFIAIFLLPLQKHFITDFEYKKDYPYYIWIWGNFDGFHYMDISKHGYSHYQHPFFPLFPILIDFLTRTFQIRRIITGQLIANISFFLTLPLLYRLLKVDKKTQLTSLLFAVIFFFPTSFFYAAVYNDSLFFLLATATLYFGRKKSWLLASLSGSLATLTRLNGLALVFFIVYEYLSDYKKEAKDTWNIRNIIKQTITNKISLKTFLQDKIYAVVLIPLSFLGYLLYTHITYGEWTMVFTAMKAWDQDKVIFPLQVFWRYLKILLAFNTNNLVYSVAVIELLFVLLYMAMMVYGYKKIRLSYWLFFVISILIPSFTGTFQGMPRYGLHIYPFFFTLTLFLAQHKRIKFLYFFASVILFIICITFFTRGYFIA